MKRRSFLSTSGLMLAGIGSLPLLNLPRIRAEETQLKGAVALHSEIEPLVRFLENTPREKIIEEAFGRIKKGVTYREMLAALFLAGVRNIQPRPVGFKFHAVLVVNSAHLASLSSPDGDRWLPLLWAIDQFKRSQEADVREGDWTLGPVKESEVPPSHRAREALIAALETWDEAAADAAIVSMARSAGANEIFEILCRYGARDFREIGHKEIYVANSFRTLEVIGWQHAEPVLRSLTYALLDRDRDRGNPAQSDFPADRPYRQNIELIKTIRPHWSDGRTDSGASRELLEAARTSGASETSKKAIELLNKGVDPSSIFDALFSGAGELLMRAPGILALHATTFTNALHYCWQRAQEDETRRLLLIQNAAFLPLFRSSNAERSIAIDRLEPDPKVAGVEEIFAELGTNRLEAARKILGFLEKSKDPKPFADEARRLLFSRGRDSHDYKFSSAVLEDYHFIHPSLRDRYLAASAFYLKGTSDPENELSRRIRSL